MIGFRQERELVNLYIVLRCFLFVSKALTKHTAVFSSEQLVPVPAKMSKGTALQTFSLTNNILEVPPQDEIYRFDADANRKFNQEMPWTKE